MKRIKVLQIGLSPNRGGIENIVYSWWKNIPKEQIIFDFLNVWDKPIAFQEEFICGGSKILYKPSRKSNPKESYKVLKSIIENGQYDFIHCHVMSLSEPEPVIIANKFSDATVIVHSHTAASRKQMGLKRFLLHMYGKLALKNCNYIRMACGNEAGIKMFGTNEFQIVRNGIDREVYKFSSLYREEIRQKYSIQEDVYLIGHVGRPCKAKNYPFLINVFAKFRENHNVKLILIGDVANDSSINHAIEKLGINEDVIFTGAIKDIYKYYSAMDCFFMPSLYEGISVALIEAQSTGLQCIVSDRVDYESKACDNLIFAPIDSIEDSVKLLEKAYENSIDRCNVKFAEEYDLENSVKSIENFYFDNMRH